MKKIILITVLIMFCGCLGKSRPTSLYLLSYSAVPESEVIADCRLDLEVGPVTVAEYLGRKQLISKVSANRLRIHDNSHWAGELSGIVQDKLVGYLRQRLSGSDVFGYPQSGEDSGVRIRITIEEFGKQAAASVELSGFYEIVSDNETLKTEVFHITEKCSGSEPNIFVAVMSSAVYALSMKIADSMKGFCQEKASEQEGEESD